MQRIYIDCKTGSIIQVIPPEEYSRDELQWPHPLALYGFIDVADEFNPSNLQFEWDERLKMYCPITPQLVIPVSNLSANT